MGEAAESQLEAPAQDAPEAKSQPVLSVSIKERLAESLKERRANKDPEKNDEAEAKAEPEKPGDDDATAKKSDEGEKKPETLDDQVAAFEKEKRGFSKFKAKKERELAAIEETHRQRAQQIETREKQVQQLEVARREEITSFKKDPVAWLIANKVPVRETLLKFANKDGEDPRDAKIAALEERLAEFEGKTEDRAKQDEEAKRKAEDEERQRRAVEAQNQIAAECQTVFEKHKDEFPLLGEMYSAKQLGRMALNVMIDEYKRTGNERIDQYEIYAKLEQELTDQAAKLEAARAKKKGGSASQAEEPPERVRSVKPESPEEKPRRRSEDISNRKTYVSTTGSDAGGREALVERLKGKARSVMRSSA